jgi:hypothetical protein
VREYHRKKWHEEQERLNQGEKEFEVPKERRPEMDGNAIATIFSGQAVEEEAVYLNTLLWELFLTLANMVLSVYWDRYTYS